MHKKIEIPIKLYSDHEDMLDEIVLAYDLPDKSKAIRCLLDYVEEQRADWDEMFQTIRCKHC